MVDTYRFGFKAFEIAESTLQSSRPASCCRSLTQARLLLGGFYKLGVPFKGVLTIRALLCGVYIRVPEFGKLPFGGVHMGYMGSLFKGLLGGPGYL